MSSEALTNYTLRYGVRRLALRLHSVLSILKRSLKLRKDLHSKFQISKRSRGLLLIPFLLISGKALAEEFVINSAELVLVDKVYQLNARVDFVFSNDVLKAIENGVPLIIEMEIEFLRPRSYIWDQELASLAQRYQLQYHALTEQYIVRNLNSGAQYTFFSLTAALQKIGNIDHLPLIDAKLLENRESKKYYARVRTQLSFDNLPVPLKLNALISRSWWLGSDWIELNL